MVGGPDYDCACAVPEYDGHVASFVGATTLRPEHVTLHSDGVAEFQFLGKDSVLWHKKLQLPDLVQSNLEELIRDARPSNPSSEGEKGHPTRDKPQLFPDISSRDVNAYLSEILPGLTAKVFRTLHATVAVQDSLESSGVTAEDPEHVKWEAVNLANLEAAVLCNHTKKAPASWPRSRKRYREREQKAQERVDKYRERRKEQRAALDALREEARLAREEAPPEKDKKVRARYKKRIETAKRRVERTQEMLERAKLARDKVKVQASIASKKRTWNLGTSLKSYVDPRVCYEWGQQVDYDVLEKYYPKALRRKFAWGREEDEEDSAEGIEVQDEGIEAQAEVAVAS